MSSPVIVDANLAIHSVVRTPLSEAADRAWTALQENDASLLAPRLFSYEVTSVVHRYLHDGLLTGEEANLALETAFNLGVELVYEDLALCRAAFDWATRLQRKAAYDAFYVALAQQLAAELWTADLRLVNALASHPGPRAVWIGGLTTPS